MDDATTGTPAATRRTGEAPLEWLARITPDDWNPTEDGYGLRIRSDRGEGDRRVVIDPLDNRATFEERVEADELAELRKAGQ